MDSMPLVTNALAVPFFCRLAAGAIALLLCELAFSFPDKPIRIIVPLAAGGNADILGRAMAQRLADVFRQNVIVDNRPGGATILGTEMVAKAPADGYTLLLAGTSHVTNATIFKRLPYDTLNEFSGVTLIATAPLLLLVHASVPASSVKELIALAKARPGELNFASSGADTRLQGELFKALAGINIVNIPYSSGAVEYADLVAGQVHLKFGSTVSVAPHVKSGRLRALTVTTAQPSALYPSLPTVAAALPGYEAAAKAAMFVPAKTPEAIINRLNQEIGRFLRTGEAKEKFANAGSEAVTSSPEEAAATVKTDMARLGKLIRDTGMRAN